VARLAAGGEVVPLPQIIQRTSGAIPTY